MSVLNEGSWTCLRFIEVISSLIWMTTSALMDWWGCIICGVDTKTVRTEVLWVGGEISSRSSSKSSCFHLALRYIMTRIIENLDRQALKGNSTTLTHQSMFKAIGYYCAFVEKVVYTVAICGSTEICSQSDKLPQMRLLWCIGGSSSTMFWKERWIEEYIE